MFAVLCSPYFSPRGSVKLAPAKRYLQNFLERHLHYGVLSEEHFCEKWQKLFCWNKVKIEGRMLQAIISTKSEISATMK